MNGYSGGTDGRKTEDYGTIEGREANALDAKDEWNRNCSRGNGTYSHRLWVRSESGV